MRRLILGASLLALLFLVGWTGPEDGPRNVRLRAQAVADSIYYRIQWVAPQRTSGQTPIEGYEWELWLSANDSINRDGTLDDLVASGATPATVRRVDGVFGLDACPLVMEDGTEITEGWIGAYVRATGNFSAPAPWGRSDPIRIGCSLDDTPPGPPTVDLDTIPQDTIATAPDSTKFLPVELGHVDFTWDPNEMKTFRFASIGDVAKICAFSYRGDGTYLAPRGGWVATMDTLQVVTDADVASVVDAGPLESACWYVTAKANGQALVHLCTTDCGPIAIALHRLGIPTPTISREAKYAGFGIGFFLWGVGIYQGRKRKKA